MKRYLSILLTVLVLISVFSVSSFADTGNMDLLASDLSYEAYYYSSSSGNFEDLNVGTTLGTFYGIQSVRYYVNAAPTGSGGKFLSVYDFENFKANHEYNISFDIATAYGSNTGFTLRLEYLNANGTVIQSDVIVDISSLGSNNTYKHINVNFTPDLTNVNTGYSLKLVFLFVSSVNGAQNYYISQNIYLNDNDDDSGWFQQIIQWLQNVRESVSTIGSNIVGGLSNLGSNISTWLTSVKDGIVNKLSDVITGINNKLETVKTYISDKIDGIQQWFINLGNSIGEFFTMLKNYILYFKHPITLNSDGVPVDSSGNPVYVNPFESALDSVEETITEWIDSVNDFIDSIDESAETVSEPLQLFKTAFTRFGNGAPFFIGIIVFAVVFFVIRKVVGR